MKQHAKVLFKLNLSLRCFFCYLLSLSIFIVTSVASADDEAIGDELLGELPVVLSASRLNQTILNTPSAVTIIDKHMIEASGFTDISDVMRLVPGFQVANLTGRVRAVNYHGGGWEYPNGLQVLVNGRSTYLPNLSVVDWHSLGVQLQDIERIEVVRGPSPSAYGSNSFLAAINIITIAPELDVKYTISGRYGSNNDRFLLMRASNQAGNTHYRLSASMERSNGFNSDESSERYRSLNLQTRSYLFDQDVLDISFAASRGRSEPLSDSLLTPRNNALMHWSAQANWQHPITKNSALAVNFYHNTHHEDDAVDSYPVGAELGLSDDLFFQLLGTHNQVIHYGLEANKSIKSEAELQYNWLSDNGLQLMLGSAVRYEQLKGAYYTGIDNQFSSTGYRLFGNMQANIHPHVVMNFGALWEKEAGHSSYLSPRASLNWTFAPRQSLRLSAARAYRLPSLLERNGNWDIALDNGLVVDKLYYSDPSLHAEEIRNIELGYQGQLVKAPIRWEFKAYHEKRTDLIWYVRDDAVSDLVGDGRKVVRNAAGYHASGLEGELVYRPSQRTFLRAHMNIISDSAHYLARMHPSVTKLHDQLAPKNSFGILGSQQWGAWQASLGIYHFARTQWLSRGDKVDSHTRIDAAIMRRMALSAHHELKVFLAGQAINGAYRAFNLDQAVEPRYYLGFTVTRL